MNNPVFLDRDDVQVKDVNRATFLRRGGSALALAAGGGYLATMSGPAFAQDSGNLDLTIAGAAAAAELLAVHTYTTAIKSGLFKGGALTYLKVARTQEQDHYDALAGILKGAGAKAPVAGDYTYKLPNFKNATDVVKFGKALEEAFISAYVLAAGALSTPELRSAAAGIAASEGSHLGFFNGVLKPGRGVTTKSIPAGAKSLDAVVATIGKYQKAK